MPKKKPTLLPEPLRYLQPFVNMLAKLPPEELEDIDGTPLEAALRKRIRGLDHAAADAKLAQDRDLLENWLKPAPDHRAHWLLAYLSLVRARQRAEPVPRGPGISFEVPNGWKVKAKPFGLDLKKGKLYGVITVIDKFSFQILQRQFEQAPLIQPPKMQVTMQISDIAFELCRGKKYLCQMTSPIPWKKVDYVLSIPGGYVTVALFTMTGADFDELPFEAQLHTLRLSASV